jgi:HNH endonuclease
VTLFGPERPSTPRGTQRTDEWWKHSSGRKTRTIAERFKEKTLAEPSTGCVLWTGALNQCGYGMLGVGGRGGRYVQATHVAFFLKYGRWPAQLNHTCDVRACVNIDHLYEGTQRENARDAIQRGRHHQTKKTHCPKWHPYSGSNLFLPARGGRACRACGLASRRAYKKRMR